jgi:hypothetical protein
MIDEPVPTMPLMVPATSPTARTKTKFMDLRLRESEMPWTHDAAIGKWW